MGKKYIVEMKEGERLYKTKLNALNEPVIREITCEPYTEPDTEAAYAHGYSNAEIKYRAEVKEAYQKGLSDAWECARKISSMDSKTRDEIFDRVITSNIVDENTAAEAIEKIRRYEQEKEEKITKGDVVRIKSAPEVEILVTYADEEHVSGIALTEVDGNCEIGDQYTDIVIHKVEKTGRHYEIAAVLQKMREE